MITGRSSTAVGRPRVGRDGGRAVGEHQRLPRPDVTRRAPGGLQRRPRGRGRRPPARRSTSTAGPDGGRGRRTRRRPRRSPRRARGSPPTSRALRSAPPSYQPQNSPPPRCRRAAQPRDHEEVRHRVAQADLEGLVDVVPPEDAHGGTQHARILTHGARPPRPHAPGAEAPDAARDQLTLTTGDPSAGPPRPSPRRSAWPLRSGSRRSAPRARS